MGGGYIRLHAFLGAQSSEKLRGGQHAEDLDIWLAQGEAAFREREREREEPSRAAVSARVLSN